MSTCLWGTPGRGGRASRPATPARPAPPTARPPPVPPPRRTAARRGQGLLPAAQARWGSRMYGLVGSITAASGALPNRSSGWATRYWSSGSSWATSTASDPSSRRPARPACCHIEARVQARPGWPRRGTDIDPQLEGNGGGHGHQLLVGQGPLQPAPLLGQVPGAVRLDPWLQPTREIAAGELRQQLRGPPGPGERDRPDPGGPAGPGATTPRTRRRAGRPTPRPRSVGSTARTAAPRPARRPPPRPRTARRPGARPARRGCPPSPSTA